MATSKVWVRAVVSAAKVSVSLVGAGTAGGTGVPTMLARHGTRNSAVGLWLKCTVKRSESPSRTLPLAGARLTTPRGSLSLMVRVAITGSMSCCAEVRNCAWPSGEVTATTVGGDGLVRPQHAVIGQRDGGCGRCYTGRRCRW